MRCDYKITDEEARFDVVCRWMHWLALHCFIFNVDNTHQCLRESPSQILRPFADLHYFYGCAGCGRYHFCYLTLQTCEILQGAYACDSPTCAYSSQVLGSPNLLADSSYEVGQQLSKDLK